MGRPKVPSLEMMPHGLFIPNVSALVLDEDRELMWIGGIGDFREESGITSWNMNRDVWTYFQSKYITNLQNDQVTSIALDDDYVWFGTQYGVSRYDPTHDEWKNFNRFSNLADNLIFDVAVDEKYVWVATANGLSCIVKSTIENDSLEVAQIAVDDLHWTEILDIELMENLVWLGTENGVFVYDVNKNVGGYHAEEAGPMDEIVYSISRYKNEVWFGLADGVEIFDVEKREWLGLPQKRFYSGETITCIKADEHVVWAGTNEGVLKYDRERQSWTKYTVEDGLIHDTINAIAVDGDYVWFGTPQGITRFYWNDPIRID